MPRAERYKKDSAKALAKAAAIPGQSKITSLFAKGNTGHDFDSASTSGIDTVITVNTEKASDCIAIRGKTDFESNIHHLNLDKAFNDKALKLLLDENRYLTNHQTYLKKEQLSFSVRTCDDNYEVSEGFVGIYECLQELSSDALLHYTKDILLRCGMEGHKMAAMGFDGASAMKSLARKLKEDIAPNAIYIHCFSHCIELFIQDAAMQSNLLSTSLDLCQSLYAIVGAHPKRILLFEEIQADFRNETGTNDYKVLRLQSLSTTRWTTRVKAADVIFEKSSELHATLEKLQEDPSILADT
ncbi:zinc finger MYM-type protein 1-like [Xenia sp. Carnegie-2017]|uniref:zinc finger MYM-type protein 1-like n=1 Tax=Xenia sp. Carnegie-2017 TaxID=2897299 RepID=UPI001F03A4B1|nr:zinc finger MYM-type protein 1-like [Xenia sp. Carnegie-2017]